MFAWLYVEKGYHPTKIRSQEANVMANSQATQGTEVNQATEVDPFLNYNCKDKKLIWNGSVNDLETFLRNKLAWLA